MSTSELDPFDAEIMGAVDATVAACRAEPTPSPLHDKLDAALARVGVLESALRGVMPWAERPVWMHRLKSIPHTSINEQTDEVEMWSTTEHDPECPQCPREAERAAACEQALRALSSPPPHASEPLPDWARCRHGIAFPYRCEKCEAPPPHDGEGK